MLKPNELSDETVICQYMETPPVIRDLMYGFASPDHWWRREAGLDGSRYWRPNTLTLDMLHKAEMKLPDELWGEYARLILLENKGVVLYEKRLVHAGLQQKIRALAGVLRRIEEIDPPSAA